MTTEFDLGCATCGGALRERSVGAEVAGVDVTEPVQVAVCADCGSRYFPESALERLNAEGRAEHVAGPGSEADREHRDQ